MTTTATTTCVFLENPICSCASRRRSSSLSLIIFLDFHGAQRCFEAGFGFGTGYAVECGLRIGLKDHVA